MNPTYRQTVVRTAQAFALHFAPPASNPQQVAQHVAALLDQVFAALRQSLAVGIQHGFTTVLIFCAGLIMAALFLKDVPLAMQFQDEPGMGNGAEPAAAQPAEYAAPGA